MIVSLCREDFGWTSDSLHYFEYHSKKVPKIFHDFIVNLKKTKNKVVKNV